MDNKIYLKDFKNHEKIQKDNIEINYYSDDKNKLNINIVVQNGNIYIEQKESNKIEIIDNDSTVELVDDHYKKIDKSIYHINSNCTKKIKFFILFQDIVRTFQNVQLFFYN